MVGRLSEFPKRAARSRANQVGHAAAPEGSTRPISMTAAHPLITVAQASQVVAPSCPKPGPVGLAAAAHANRPQTEPITTHPRARNR
jgi:hypothetical protein